MKTEDLKDLIKSANSNMELILKTKIKIRYDKPTFFQYINETSEWKLMKDGTNTVVHPLFYDQFEIGINDIMLELDTAFISKFYDPELLYHYRNFKNNLFKISNKLISLDQEEEKKGRHYLTYEQILNSTWFTFNHLYCIYIDYDIGMMDESDYENYNTSIELFKFYQSKSLHTTMLLNRACEYADINFSSNLIKLLSDANWTDNLKIFLDEPRRRCA